MEDQSLVDCLHTLIMAKSNEVIVDGFEMEELDLMPLMYIMMLCIIYYITCIFNSVLYTILCMISINNKIIIT